MCMKRLYSGDGLTGASKGSVKWLKIGMHHVLVLFPSYASGAFGTAKGGHSLCWVWRRRIVPWGGGVPHAFVVGFTCVGTGLGSLV